MNMTLDKLQSSESVASPENEFFLKKFGEIDTVNNLAEITLYDNGIIKSCSQAGAELLGCTVNALLLRHVSKVLPQLAEVALIKGDRVNPYLRFLSRVGHHFEVVGISGSHFFSALFFNDIEELGRHCMRIIFRPVSALQ